VLLRKVLCSYFNSNGTCKLFYDCNPSYISMLTTIHIIFMFGQIIVAVIRYFARYIKSYALQYSHSSEYWKLLIVNLSVVEFIEGISQFSVKGNKDAKLQCKHVVI